MAASLLYPPDQLSLPAALQMSQLAPALLDRPESIISFLPVAPFQGADLAETWMGYEHVLLSCLRTRHDQAARRCLERLTDRFGASNPRVMGFKGLYEEAVAEDEAALDRILRGYESILNSDPTNTVGLASVTCGVIADSSTADRETKGRSS